MLRGVSHKLFIDSNVMAAPINRLVFSSTNFPPPPPRAIAGRMAEHCSRSPLLLRSLIKHSPPPPLLSQWFSHSIGMKTIYLYQRAQLWPHNSNLWISWRIRHPPKVDSEATFRRPECRSNKSNASSSFTSILYYVTTICRSFFPSMISNGLGTPNPLRSDLVPEEEAPRMPQAA